MSKLPPKKIKFEPDTPAVPAKDAGREPAFQFGEADESHNTWIRRAIDAGIRYTKTLSERSGIKTRRVRDLHEGDKNQPPASGKPPAAPVETYKPAFGPPERTLFKTAINEFLSDEK